MQQIFSYVKNTITFAADFTEPEFAIFSQSTATQLKNTNFTMNIGNLPRHLSVLCIVLFAVLFTNNTFAQCISKGNCFNVVIVATNPRLVNTSPNGGNNTQAQVEFDYEITITNNTCNFNGSFWTLQGNILHGGSQVGTIENKSYFPLPTNTGQHLTGIARTSTFTYYSNRPDTIRVSQVVTGVEFRVHGNGIDQTITCNFTTPSPLPVELVSFDATCNDMGNIISWSTSSEQNNKMFNLYKSEDAKEWNLIASEKGNGNSNQLLNYEIADNSQSSSNTVYYRLEQIDYSGRTTAYNPISLECEKNGEKNVLIFPNPIQENTVVRSSEEMESFRIFNLTGQVILVESNIQSHEAYLLQNISLQTGVYIVEITLQSGDKVIQKIIKN